MQLIPGDAKRLERVVRRVLVAEDDEDTRTLLAWGLRLHGYEVVECKSGTELFEVLTMCLNAEEQMDLLALIYLGRGDFGLDEWSDALSEARDRIDARDADFMIGDRALPAYLGDALEAFGKTCPD